MDTKIKWMNLYCYDTVVPYLLCSIGCTRVRNIWMVNTHVNSGMVPIFTWNKFTARQMLGGGAFLSFPILIFQFNDSECNSISWFFFLFFLMWSKLTLESPSLKIWVVMRVPKRINFARIDSYFVFLKSVAMLVCGLNGKKFCRSTSLDYFIFFGSEKKEKRNVSSHLNCKRRRSIGVEMIRRTHHLTITVRHFSISIYTTVINFHDIWTVKWKKGWCIHYTVRRFVNRNIMYTSTWVYYGRIS